HRFGSVTDACTWRRVGERTSARRRERHSPEQTPARPSHRRGGLGVAATASSYSFPHSQRSLPASHRPPIDARRPDRERDRSFTLLAVRWGSLLHGAREPTGGNSSVFKPPPPARKCKEPANAQTG
ncbi:hypothetical protein chiPu_0031983, partial [Chiloscyllium punctatum]|nr:hypothetical protein [Chiloscyllium punctatum]